MQREKTYSNQQAAGFQPSSTHRQTEFDRAQLKTSVSASTSGKDITLSAHLSASPKTGAESGSVKGAQSSPFSVDVAVKGLNTGNLETLGKAFKGINDSVSQWVGKGVHGISKLLGETHANPSSPTPKSGQSDHRATSLPGGDLSKPQANAIISQSTRSFKEQQYTMKSGDTLWGIAEKQLGDGKRWTELHKKDGSAFTAKEAQKLSVGTNVFFGSTKRQNTHQPSTGSSFEPSPVKPASPKITPRPSSGTQPTFDKATGHINQPGLDLVKGFEGFRSKAYQDTGGKWAIGYGHAAGVDPGETISKAQGEAFLKQDIGWAENAVRQAIHVPLNSNQFAALTSLAHNVGSTGLKKSEVAKQVNAGNYQKAADSFGEIVHDSKGHRLEGLVRRRSAERELFLKPDAGGAANTSTNNKTGSSGEKPSGADHQTYTVQKGDTLSGIAQKELGDANRWHDLGKADGSGFTEQDARKLQPGTTVFMPRAKQAGEHSQPTRPGSGDPKQKLVDVAKSYQGVVEVGNNRGAKVQEFQKSVGGHPGDAWCMEFAQYCVKQVEGSTSTHSKIARSANVMEVWHNAQKQGITTSRPEPGSLAIFQWSPKPGNTHVGIVKSVDPDGKGFTTIEGNTTDPKGSGTEGVFEKHRPMNGTVRGFVKPF